ncbi:MAG: Gfo/Idh/MocA family oxidoreductase [Nitrososphaerales archaeon]
MVKVGVIGVGGWGKNHLRVLKELNVLSSFCDIDITKVKMYEERYGIKGYTSVDEMLKNEDLDAVTICTPTSTHYEIGMKTIGLGLDTFIEKPLTYSSREGEELVSLAREKNVILTVGYIERFNPAVIELKKILKNGEVGEPLLLEFHRENRWAGQVRDVGVVMDTSVHDIDTARWIFEKEPKLVFARTGKVISDYEDFATIILGFDREKTAFITSNWVTPKRVRQLITVCTNGIVTIDFITQEIKIDDNERTIIPRKEWQEPLMLELKSFIDCVRRREPPLIKGEDGVNITKIAEAALISSQIGSPIYLQLG